MLLEKRTHEKIMQKNKLNTFNTFTLSKKSGSDFRLVMYTQFMVYELLKNDGKQRGSECLAADSILEMRKAKVK